MNKEIAIANLRKSIEEYTLGYQKAINLLESIDKRTIDLVDYQCGNDLYFSPQTYAKNMNLLHKLRKHSTFELLQYSLTNGGKHLELKYADDKKARYVTRLCIWLVCTDRDNALRRVGNGKCRIVEKTDCYSYTSTKQEIVCDLSS